MEQKNKREWVKNAIIIFLIVMLILTLFSNTIMNYSLPEVSAQYCYSGQITNKVRGTGVVEAADPYSVVVKEARKIDSVAVRVGDEVEKGAVIYVLEDGESTELKEAMKTLEQMKNEYEQAVITGAVPSSVTTAIDSGTIGSLQSNQAKLEASKNNVEYWKSRVDSLSKLQTQYAAAPEDYNSEKKAIENAQESLDAWTEQNSIDKGDLAEASANYNSSKSAYESKLTDINKEKAYLKRVTNGDISSNDDESVADIQKRITLMEDELKFLKQTYDKDNTAYQSAVTKEANSAEMVNYCKQLLKDSQNALENKTYTISVDLSNAQSNLEKAQKAYDELLQDLSTLYGLEDKVAAIKEQEKEVEKLRESSVGGEITAPVAGTILSLAYVAGETIETGHEVASIQKAGKGFTLSMNITSEQAKYVGIGDEAEVSNSWWYSDIHARVTKIIADRSNPQNGKIVLFEMEGDLTSGQSLTLTVGNKTNNYDCIVPNSAIREDNNGKFIYIVESKSTPFGNRYVAKRVDVNVLAEDDKESAVSGDLSGWEYVITNSSKPVEENKQVRLKD
ncbi:MAG: HlyD family efflux transporter periplasmic adaptor subunit [Lachnospiraceae bacterium]|nr:HlyD family efflux transporter periplasmic adaptor subunit [Lachnospiraceae bacterium]